MKRITISILFSACILFVACGGRSASGSDSDVNPRDTVKVPEGYSYDPEFEMQTGNEFGEWFVIVKRN